MGCSKRPSKVVGADVDPVSAAARAIQSLDKSGDGAVDAAELAACPPLLQSLASVDANSDGAVSVDELQKRLAALFGSGSALTNFDCTVILAGRPLGGATLKLTPVEWLADSLVPAEGVTDDQGIVRPTIGDEHLPDKLKGAPLVHPGLYRVEITHAQSTIPPRYNTATELGAEIDPSSRTGTSARFDLKSN